MIEADVRAALMQKPRHKALRGDYDLNPAQSDERPSLTALRPAAVLVPIMRRAGGLSLLFTKRTATLKHHADQVSFPGGKVDPADRDAVSTALREAKEEIGLPASHVEVIGELDDYETRTGFHIVPVVGFVEPRFNVVLNTDEVAAIFEVPLAFVLDVGNQHQRTARFGDRASAYYEFNYDGYRIWGATAGIMVNFAHVLNGTPQ